MMLSHQIERRTVLVAAGGWLLLATGLAVLGLDSAPPLLQGLDEYLQAVLVDSHIDAPMPPGVWLPALVLLLAGMVLVGRTARGVTGSPDTCLVTRVAQAPRPASDLPFSYCWLALALVGNLIWVGVVIAAAKNFIHWSIIPSWLMAIAIQAACWWRADCVDGKRPFAGSNSRFTVRWLSLMGLVVAFGVTLYRLGDVPNSIWGDEGAFWEVARDLAAGVRVNPFALGVYSAYPLMSSLYQSWWLEIFGSTLWSWRLGSVVAGTLTIAPLFFLARRLLGARVAWSAAVLMIGLPYFLSFTRMGYNNIQPLLPITTGLWLLVEAVYVGSRVLAYLAGVALGVAALTYTAGYIGLVLAALVLSFLFASQPLLRRSMIGLALCLGMGWLLAAGPFFLGGVLGGGLLGGKGAESFFGNAFYGEAIFSSEPLTRLYPLWQVGGQQIFFEPRLYALLIGRGLARTALSLAASEVAAEHYLVGPLTGPGAPFFLAGLAWAVSQRRRLPGALWVIWVFVCLLLLSVFNTFPPRATHMTPIIPAIAVLAATGIWMLSDLVRHVVRPLWADWIGVGLTILLALAGLRAYFVTMPRQYTPDLPNVMFWRAQELAPAYGGAGSSLVFVTSKPYPPEFRVGDIDTFDLGVKHHSVPIEDAPLTDFRALCGGLDAQSSCRVFFLPDSVESLRSQLRTQLGAGTIQTHFDRYGWPIGLEFTPGDWVDAVFAHGQSVGQSSLCLSGVLGLGVLVAILLVPPPVGPIFSQFLIRLVRREGRREA